MFYIWTLDAHELHGPFTDMFAAHRYAAHRSLSSYTIENRPLSWMHESIRPVPLEFRA